MKYKYIYEGKKTFISYPEGVVTLNKIYESFTDFEIPNTLLFVGDDGKKYKLIKGYFKIQKL